MTDAARIEVITKMLEEFPKTRKAIVEWLYNNYEGETK